MNRTAAAIFLALVCAGCPKRVEFGPEGPLTDPWEVLERVRLAQSQAVSLQGEARLRLESPQGRGSAGAWLAVMQPGRLRLEVYDFFNRPVALLVTDGERFGYYEAQQARFFRGPASVDNLARLLPVALPPSELVALLLGQVPLLPAEQAMLRLEDNLYVLTLQRGGVIQQLHVHPTHLRVVRSQVRGAPAYDLEYGDFRPHGEQVLPHELELRAAAANTRVHLRYTDVSLNETLEPSTFEPVPPPGARVVEVDAQGQELPGLTLPPPPPGEGDRLPPTEGGGSGNLR